MSKQIRNLNALILFVVFILMDLSFKGSLIEMFEYMGFQQIPTSLLRSIFAYLLILSLIFITSFKKISLFAHFILQLIIIFLTFPTIILFKNMNSDMQILFAHLLFFSLTYFCFKFVKFRIKSKPLKSNQRFIFLFILSIIMVIPFIITYKLNVDIKNFLLIDIYETRAIQKEINNPLLGYTYSWLGRIIIPTALLFSFSLKKYYKSIILVFLLSYLFLIGAHKSILAGSLVLIIFYFIPRKYVILSLSSVIVLILGMGYLIYTTSGNYYISSLITRRVFFIPALLDTYYFDFFNGKPLYWSSSFLRNFIEYPYELQPPYLIGENYFNQSSMSANNGIISDGYSNFGWIGVLINISIVSLMLSFFNSLRINHKFYGLFVLFFLSIVSSYLPTLLLTHGGILLILVSQFILKDTSSQINKH